MSEGGLHVEPLSVEKLEKASPRLDTQTAIKPGPRLPIHTSDATSEVLVIGTGVVHVAPLLPEKLAKALLLVSCHAVKKPAIVPLTMTAELTVPVLAIFTMFQVRP